MITRRVALVSLLVCVANGTLLWHFHDLYWYPTDDGFYAHLAERLLHGEVLNATIQDIHPGYIHFVHAAAFRLFGVDMVSLRYPLMLAEWLQGCFVYALLQRRSVLLAALGSVTITALSALQFYDPTPNWYCLCLCVIVACWMVWVRHNHAARLVGAGVLIGVLTLFRQLSGVWVMMAVLVLALLERSTDGRGRALLLSRILVGIMVAGIVGYLIVSPETEPGGFLLIAIWPLAILLWLFVNTRTTNSSTALVVAQLAAGAALPAIPLAIYHIAHNSLGGWINDTVLAAFGETLMPFFGHGWYGVLPLAALYQVVSSLGAVKILNGLYWVILPTAAAINGVIILRKIGKSRPQELALPVLASFYALVSMYLEGPLYLYYSVGLSIVSILWFVAAKPRATQVAAAIATAAICLVAVVFHAGQGRLRTPVQILEGSRVSNVWRRDRRSLDRCSFRLEAMDYEVYRSLVSTIQRESQPDDAILAIPNDAELYFLADRRNPFRFYNSALGIRTEAELKQVTDRIAAAPPRLVAFRPDDKYNTSASIQIMDLVKSRYDLLETTAGLEIYRLR